MFIYSYKCDNCSFCAEARSGAVGYYRTSTGEQIHAICSAAWCKDCHTIVDAEDMPNRQFLESELQRLSREGPDGGDRTLAEEFGLTIEEYCVQRIETWQRVLTFFQGRRSRERCVQCGSSEIHFLRGEDGQMPDRFPHPQCHGQLRLTQRIIANPYHYFVLDKEGRRLV